LAAATGADGRLYALGGYDVNGNVLSSVEVGDTGLTADVVRDAPLAASGINLGLTAGQPFSGVAATFTDGDPSGKLADYTASIDWGDGTTTQPDVTPGTVLATAGGGFAVTGAHTYTGAGTFPLKVEVTDAGGSQAQAVGTLAPFNASSVLPMITARNGFAAATGSDGRIYALGGYNNFGNTLSSVERYDPATNLWTALAPMNTGRSNFGAATGPDGSIYAFGGFAGDGTALSSVERYDPVKNTWSPVANMKFARGGLAAVTGSDGRIYAIGGHDFGNPNADLPLRVERYDPVANTWSSVANTNFAHVDFAAARDSDGRIYAIGASGFNERYDPATDTWSSVANMNVPRSGLAAATGADGHIYALGGQNSAGQFLSSVEGYDPATNTWTAAAPMSSARFSLAAATGSDGRIYALGGAVGNVESVSSVEVTDTGVRAVVVQAPASQLVVAGFPPVVAGTPGTFTVTAVDRFGQTVTSYTGTVSFFATGQATLPAATLLNGTGTFPGTLFTAGLQTLAVTDGTISGQENAIVVMPAGPAHATITSGAAQSAVVNTDYGQPLEVLVTDAYDNPIGRTPVVFTAPATAGSPGGTFGVSATAMVMTNAHGVATAPAFTANTKAGGFAVAATGLGLATASISLTNTAGPPTTIAVVGSTTQSAKIKTSYLTPLQVQVTDAFGNPVGNVSVTFTTKASTTGANGLFGGNVMVTTDVNGMATAPTLTANSKLGTFTVTAATAGVATSASFSLTNSKVAPAAHPLHHGAKTSRSLTAAKPFWAALNLFGYLFGS